MKKLLVYLKDCKKEVVLAPLFKLLEACFELFVPLVIASIIDKGISLATCRERALNLLNNEDFCFAHYRDLTNEEE